MNALRTARLAASLTQAEVARRAGTTQSAVARAERPDANPRLQTLQRMARAVGQEIVLRPLPPAPVDLSQLEERLRLTPRERLEAFTASQRNLTRLRDGGRSRG